MTRVSNRGDEDDRLASFPARVTRSDEVDGVSVALSENYVGYAAAHESVDALVRMSAHCLYSVLWQFHGAGKMSSRLPRAVPRRNLAASTKMFGSSLVVFSGGRKRAMEPQGRDASSRLNVIGLAFVRASITATFRDNLSGQLNALRTTSMVLYSP